MMPLDIFASAQFSAANLVTFVVYGALGGVFFLLVAFLQISLGYSPIESGAASLPVTALMLVLSSRSGALAQRIGPRLPLTVGPIVIAAGMLLMTRIHPGTSYTATVLPAVVTFGLGLTLVVAPVTATVLAAADERHSGIASGINNAVSRVAGLLAVAILPTIAGLSGRRFYNPTDPRPRVPHRDDRLFHPRRRRRCDRVDSRSRTTCCKSGPPRARRPTTRCASSIARRSPGRRCARHEAVLEARTRLRLGLGCDSDWAATWTGLRLGLGCSPTGAADSAGGGVAIAAPALQPSDVLSPPS